MILSCAGLIKAIVVSAMCASTQFSQNSAPRYLRGGWGTVKGEVTDKDARRVNQVSVRIVSLGDPGAQPLFTVTDHAGEFLFTGLPPGKYKVYTANDPTHPKTVDIDDDEPDTDEVKFRLPFVQAIKINPEAATSINYRAKKHINPEAARTINPQAAKTIDWRVAIYINPAAAATINAAAAKTIKHEAAKTINPEAARVLNPDGAKYLTAEVARTLTPQDAAKLTAEEAKRRAQPYRAPARR